MASMFSFFSNAAAAILGMTYGIDVQYKGDRFIAISEKAIERMGQAACPGAFLVNLILACTFLLCCAPNVLLASNAQSRLSYAVKHVP